eukprot:gene16342-biopygen497
MRAKQRAWEDGEFSHGNDTGSGFPHSAASQSSRGTGSKHLVSDRDRAPSEANSRHEEGVRDRYRARIEAADCAGSAASIPGRF